MQIELAKVNIDRYIDWYFRLTVDIELLPVKMDKMKRYLLASYSLHTRYIVNKANVKSLELSKSFKEEGARLEIELEKIKHYAAPELRSIYAIFSFDDWSVIRYSRPHFLNHDVELFQEKQQRSILEVNDLVNWELRTLSTEKLPARLEFYIEGQPLPPSPTILTEFMMDICVFDYAHYLDSLANNQIEEVVELSTATPVASAEQDRKLTLAEAALLHVYWSKVGGRPITKLNQDELAATYHLTAATSGRHLYLTFCKYFKDSERVNINTSNKKSASEHLRRFERIIPILKIQAPTAAILAQREFDELSKKYDKYFG
ncbi:hypothetical protein [Chitinophaga sp. HK235]|uniref:hypothetical protein n=1 Tax=Chitinophaga sp. HK235 TaxID=2952571 RepID=UPI001BACEF85|nr:hypothetical protein [Chitinophaga sp. HK235]